MKNKEVEKAIKNSVLSFSKQKSRNLYQNLFDESFRKKNPEGKWFYAAFDQVKLDAEYDGLPSAESFWRDRISLEVFSIFKRVACVDPDVIIALSGELQESRSTQNMMLVILPNEQIASISFILEFSKNNQIEFSLANVHGVRKQLDLASEAALVISKSNGSKYKTIGVVSSALAKKFPHFYFKQRMNWEFYMPEKRSARCRLCYDQAAIFMPQLNITHDIEGEIKNWLQRKRHSNAEKAAFIISRIIETAKECSHGAIFIFSTPSDIATEAERLTCMKNIRKKSLFVMDRARKSYINRITSIDGAVLVDYDGYCYAYGAILDGKTARPGRIDRGSRHNSSRNYVIEKNLTRGKNCSPFIAVVKSEDGMITVFPIHVYPVKCRRSTLKLTV